MCLFVSLCDLQGAEPFFLIAFDKKKFFHDFIPLKRQKRHVANRGFVV